MDVRPSNSSHSSEPSPALHGAGIYSPLDKSNSEIRLLTLSTRLTGLNDTAQLHASIETFSLDSGNIPMYHALSYEWNPPDSPSTTMPLIIDGKAKQVSTNLYYALTCLFKSSQFGTQFWADALCINQEDTAERNHQVQLMWRIYNKSVRVCVWLGFTWTMGAGQCAANLLREFETRALGEEDLVQTMSYLLHDENYKDHWEAINSLFSQSYWNRSWIIQELVAAKLAVLLTNEGPYTSGDIFLDRFMLFLKVPPAELSSFERPTNWATIRSSTADVDEKVVGHRKSARPTVEGIFRTKMRHTQEDSRYHNDLLSLLVRFCGQLATDPRDRVYSLLGMEEPNSDNSIRVDYTLEWTEVFRDAAIYVIRDRNDLELLVYAGSSVTELPSWVPNWLDQERQGTTRFPHDRYCLTARCCSPHTAQTPPRADRDGPRLPNISADGSLLTISASLFNIQPCSKADSSDVDMEACKDWAPLGELGDIMFATSRANCAIFDSSDPGGFPLLYFGLIWWHVIFYFYPGASEIFSQEDFLYYIATVGQQTLTERQWELLQRALDEQFPFLTEVTPLVGSAIFRSNTFPFKGSERLAKRILDRQASVYIPGMCFWSSERGPLGPNHVLASIPLCRFPMILYKPEGSGAGYTVATSARAANLEHGQIPQKHGPTFELLVQEIDLV